MPPVACRVFYAKNPLLRIELLIVMKNWNLPKILNTPLGIVVTVAASIFGVELLLMALLIFLRPIFGLSDITWNAVDSISLTVVVTPLLYLLVFRKIRESEEYLRQINTAAQDAIVVIDEQCRVVDWNLAAQEMFQYGREEALGQRLHQLLIPPRFRADVDHGFARFRESGAGPLIGKITEVMAMRKDGGEICAELSISAVNVQGGWHAIGIIRDITERKRAEEATANARKKLITLFESISDAVLIVDMNGRFVHVNNSACTRLGYSYEEMLQIGPADIDTPEYAAKVPERIKVILEQGKLVFETAQVRKDGAVIQVELNSRVIDYDGNPAIMSVVRDITERKRAETELRNAKEQAEAATRLKDQFVALISHDLRSPLISIKGAIDMAKEDGQEGLQKTGKDHTFDRISRSTEGLITLIERLLDHSRLQAGSIKPEMRFINVRSLVEEQIGRISHLALVKNIAIHDTLPESMHIYADPDLYGEVIQNLLSNAIKFTLRGGRVDILSPDDASVVVRDNGIGIDEKLLPDLFDSEMKTTTFGTDGEKGLGLGLPYAFDIMKAHGGSLTAMPIKNAGAEFHVILPKHETIVIIVDDNDIQRIIMRDMIAKLNSVRVVEAHNGADALDMLQHVMPAVIITDIQMPVMDGFELVRRIRDLPQYEMVPIMVVTAFAGTDHGEMREKLSTLGADDFIAKPLTEDKFLPVVARYLGIV